jgi:hypothetical protein
MFGAKIEELLTNKNQVLAKWKEHFEEHLNEGSKSEQPTRPVDLRDDGVDIDLPGREGNRKGAEIPEKQQGSRRGFYRGRAVEKTVDLIWWMHYMQ